MLRPGSLALTLLLSMLTGIGPLSMDMYLASLPSIGRLLDAPTSQVQLTISAYLIGFAISQIFHGPLSDRHGRRPLLLATLGIYLLATLACALAPSIETLIAARCFQAVGGSGASVLARAIVRDMYEGSRIGRELARMAAIMALAPLVAPLIGGVLETAFGWRSNFVVLFCFGAAAWVMVWFLLPETLRQRAPEPVSIGSTLRSYRRFLADKGFVIHLGIATCCLSGLFAWISSAAFVIQDIYGLSALAFGLAFAVGSSGYMVGTMIAARFVMRWGSGKTMGFGAACMALGGLTMIVQLAFTPHGAVGVIAAVGLYLIGMGMTLAQAQAGALLPFPDRAGAASSLLGFTTQTVSAIVGAILGHTLGLTAWPLAIAMVSAGGLSLLLWTLSRNARARGGTTR
ncbi:MAG: Bcr/CflA family efflux MFS transporter [Xanthobacteraceae bacterium]|nr:Bcr/CflA family efflux MFS transporter [Xanthobacteraceae bacterium]